MTYRFACFVVPHIGGTYTVFKSLRAGLAPHQIDVRWLGASRTENAPFDCNSWVGHMGTGELVTRPNSRDKDLACAVARHIFDNYDGVFVNVLADRLLTNLVRYLPAEVRRIMIVHATSLGTFNAARSIREYVHATVGVSSRAGGDLVARYGFDPARTTIIQNAIDLDQYPDTSPRSTNRKSKSTSLLSLGRIEEATKGVFWLPELLRKLGDLGVTLTVAGDGPDEGELRRRCSDLEDRVTFLGQIPESKVPGLFTDHDLFIMPSRTEGFGQTIVEAMAAGCVPIVSRLHGVTDTIITDGTDGMLFRVGDTNAAADAIRCLALDRNRLAQMSRAARRAVKGRFDLATQATAYAEVVKQVMHDPPPVANPLRFDHWRYPRGLRKGLRTYLPDPLKNVMRTWRERLAS